MEEHKRIAIIGSGISGLTCGYMLSKKYDVSLYEANDYLGGHTATKPIQLEGKTYNVDTGFIVFNDWTYPNFIKLMSHLGVDSQPTQMSFSVQNIQENLEYNGHTLNTLFAQRRNIFSPRFHNLVRDILRFNKLCKAELSSEIADDSITLIDFIDKHDFSDVFTKNYILPMCAAIWSASLETAGRFPLQFFLKFFNNHGLLNIQDRPQWHTIIGGSFKYIDPITEPFKDNIHLSTPVHQVAKSESGVCIKSAKGEHVYDDVIFACHSDQALKMLDQTSLDPQVANSTKEILGAIPYAMNDVVLHTDTNMLPDRKLAWASWNYRIKDENSRAPATVSYNMNILQRITSPKTFVVTLNDTASINPDTILGSYQYAHPQFSTAMVEAQERRHEICGVDNFHYCGAYWYNGFHEDGVRSALDVCQRFGVSL